MRRLSILSLAAFVAIAGCSKEYSCTHIMVDGETHDAWQSDDGRSIEYRDKNGVVQTISESESFAWNCEPKGGWFRASTESDDEEVMREVENAAANAAQAVQ